MPNLVQETEDVGPQDIDATTRYAVEGISLAMHAPDGLLVMPAYLDDAECWTLGVPVSDDSNDVYILGIVINPDLIGRLKVRGDFVLQYQCGAAQ